MLDPHTWNLNPSYRGHFKNEFVKLWLLAQLVTAQITQWMLAVCLQTDFMLAASGRQHLSSCEITVVQKANTSAGSKPIGMS